MRWTMVKLQILKKVMWNPGINVTQVMRTVKATYSHVSKMINELICEGWIYKKENKKDKRVKELYPKPGVNIEKILWEL